jgi:hypothetical protein
MQTKDAIFFLVSRKKQRRKKWRVFNQDSAIHAEKIVTMVLKKIDNKCLKSTKRCDHNICSVLSEA